VRRDRVEPTAADLRRLRYRLRHLVALVVALVLGLGAAVPAFAAEEPRSFQAQVVGGTAVQNGEYPFVSALLDVRWGNNGYKQQFCGGSLIDQDSVLTAAHCLVTPRRYLRVVVGRTVLSSGQGQVRMVSEITAHPHYRGNVSDAYDVAVLDLTRPVSGISPITPAPVGSDSLERPGRLATIAGWGNTIAQPAYGSDGTNYPDRMRKARVPLVSDTDCRAAYGQEFYPSLMVCAGKKGVDTCQGDSGGPMWVKAAAGRRQIGITSFGRGCGARGYPGVYTEVNAPSIRNFIQQAANN
jgi:secreted trypsin-like serine protease